MADLARSDYATDEEFDFTMTVNLRHSIWLTNLVAPQMAERRDGSIVLMSSIAASRVPTMTRLPKRLPFMVCASATTATCGSTGRD